MIPVKTALITASLFTDVKIHRPYRGPRTWATEKGINNSSL